MAASIPGITLSIPRLLTPDSPKITTTTLNPSCINIPTTMKTSRAGRMYLVRSAPDKGLSELIASSIENAKESCADDPTSGECVAAWDEVEELSAASSHARDKAKDSDPLETYCKDNPETDECRTYED